MKVRILAEAGAQLKAFPHPPVASDRVGCGVDRTSSRLSVFLGICSDSRGLEPVLPPFLSGQPGLAGEGAGPLVLVGGRGAPASTRRVSVCPTPLRQPAPCFWLPFPASESYPAAGPQGRAPARRSALLGAVPEGGLACALGPDVSASRAVSRETLLCMVMGCQGRHTPFLWAWAAAARAQARMAMAGGVMGEGGRTNQEHHQVLRPQAGAESCRHTLGALSARY